MTIDDWPFILMPYWKLLDTTLPLSSTTDAPKSMSMIASTPPAVDEVTLGFSGLTASAMPLTTMFSSVRLPEPPSAVTMVP